MHKAQTCHSTHFNNLYDYTLSWSSIPGPSFRAFNPPNVPGTGSKEDIERVPLPTPSPIVSRLSTAAHLSNPYHCDNPSDHRFPNFNAPHSSQPRPYESPSSTSQIPVESASSNES